MRYHSREHRALTFRGRSGDDLVFECHGTDGRTYTLMLDAGDVPALAEAFEALADTGGGRWPATRRGGHG